MFQTTEKVVPKDKVKRALNEMEGEKLVAGISVKQVEESLPSELAYRTTAQYEHTAQPTKQGVSKAEVVSTYLLTYSHSL